MIQVAAVVLAGGEGRRMGGADKALLPLAGRPLLGHVLDRLGPQIAHIALAGGPAGARREEGQGGRLAGFGRPVLDDPLDGFAGPLAGLLAGMDWAKTLGAGWLLSVSCDVPFLPADLVVRLSQRAGEGNADVVRAASGAGDQRRAHHVIALWSLSLAGDLRDALLTQDQRGVGRFAAAHRVAEVVWEDAADPFANVNGPEDLAAAEARCASS